MMRMISIIFGVAAVAVLTALISQSPDNSVPNEKPSAANESTFSMQINNKCGNSAEGVQARSITADVQTLTYRGYVAQKVNKNFRMDAPPGYGLSSPVNVSYATISRRGKVIATFDAGVYFGLGNATEMGFFSLLNNGRKQLIISQDVPKGGRQWVVDFAKDANIIFDGQQFGVGREVDDLSISDLDGDGIYEIEVPITRFYGFEKSRLTTSETPLPGIVFKFDGEQERYLPANPLFKDCLLKDIEEAEKKFRSQSEHEVRLGDLMSVTLDYIFAGEEPRGWKFFDETCKLPDKDRIKADMKKELKSHPVYRYIYQNLTSNERSGGIRAVDFANYSYSAAAIYTNRKTFMLEDGTYEGLLIPGCKGSDSDCHERHEPVSLVAQTYGDVTGDGVEEAMVVLTESIRGSAIPYYIYVFGIEKKRPKLLWAVATGDRAEGGLRKVYSENGELVIELYGNGARVNGNVFAGDGNGACCPLSITRTRYRWKANRFVQRGKSEIFPSNGGGDLEMEYRQPD